MKKQTKEIRINIRVPENEKRGLESVASQLNVTETLIVREAVKQKLNELNAKIRESSPGEVVTI